jgi:hypothetical protein
MFAVPVSQLYPTAFGLALAKGEALVEAVEALHQCLHPKKAVLMHRVETVEAVEVFFYTGVCT